jgi:hypothetical protein
MQKPDIDEAMTVLTTVLNGLLATVTGQSGTAGARTRYLCGALATNGATELGGGGPQFWIDLGACFEAAFASSATFDTMDVVRSAAEALTPKGLPAIAVKNFAVRMALAEQARILAAMTFTSRQDIDRYFDRINASFDAAELVAADNLDNVAYMALITIHAAVSNDLANRSRPLPRMAVFTFPTSLPALNIAQRIYSDPSRSDELVAENKVIHPLFMPPVIDALSD